MSSTYGRSALEAECRIVAATSAERHRRLYASARNVGELVGGGVLDIGEARAALVAAGLATGLPGKEVHRTVRDGLGKGMTQPRQPPPGRLRAVADPSPRPPQTRPLTAPERGRMAGHRWQGLCLHPNEDVRDADAIRLSEGGQPRARVLRRVGHRFEVARLAAPPFLGLAPGEVLAAGAGVELLCDAEPWGVVIVPAAEWLDTLSDLWPEGWGLAVLGVAHPASLRGLPVLAESARRFPRRMFVSGALPAGTASLLGFDLFRLEGGAA